MKKFVIAALALFLTLINFQVSAQVQTDYRKSDIYTQADMDAAIEIINEQFSQWEGCTLLNIRYAGDDCNSAENLRWMNELANARKYDVKFVQCIEFLSDFYASKDTEGHTTFEPDSEYKNWQWWLARAEGGNWQLMSFGY